MIDEPTGHVWIRSTHTPYIAQVIVMVLTLGPLTHSADKTAEPPPPRWARVCSEVQQLVQLGRAPATDASAAFGSGGATGLAVTCTPRMCIQAHDAAAETRVSASSSCSLLYVENWGGFLDPGT